MTQVFQKLRSDTQKKAFQWNILLRRVGNAYQVLIADTVRYVPPA